MQAGKHLVLSVLVLAVIAFSANIGWAETAAEHGMSMHACCDLELVVGEVQRGSCVDPELLRLNGANIGETVPKAPSRKRCGCRASVDIGAYDTCIGGCVYCYANRNKQRAVDNFGKHDADDTALAEAFMDKPD